MKKALRHTNKLNTTFYFLFVTARVIDRYGPSAVFPPAGANHVPAPGRDNDVREPVLGNRAPEACALRQVFLVLVSRFES